MVAVHPLVVMRSKHTAPGRPGPGPTYSPLQILLVTAGGFLAIPVLLAALANPAVAVAAVAVGVGARAALRTVSRHRAARRTGGTRRYCVPLTNVCVES